ncbi:DUF2236 domain-containing protein [Rhodococcus hoagii]|nr:DUF2236 domain-containing protein [Prescottella equi]NKZ86755.1 DUF2236 domain-containing protein [Prescottella equi]
MKVVEGLDPVTRHQDILRITSGYEFPWDYQRSLEFALFRTYCVPSISELLAHTGEFEKRPQKRYDDTALLMSELVEHGYDSPRGRESLRNINRMHGRYTISNDDMLYVLSTFVYDPIDWIDRYGWRRLHPHERLASSISTVRWEFAWGSSTSPTPTRNSIGSRWTTSGRSSSTATTIIGSARTRSSCSSRGTPASSPDPSPQPCTR